MMMSEFIERTGFEPTADEYSRIEEEYYEFDGDKDAFCKRWKKDEGVNRLARERAVKIADLEDRFVKTVEQIEQERKARNAELKALTERLDKELEWHPCSGGTNMKRERYEELAKDGRELTEEEAKDLIYREFGFAREMVKIIMEVSTYEANKYHQMRKLETYLRKPVYFASDWNYIRFDCAGSTKWLIAACSHTKIKFFYLLMTQNRANT